MRKNNLTPLQYGFLSFSYLYGGTLLSSGAYRAEHHAWLAALLGCALGLLFLLWLGRLAEEEQNGKRASACLRSCTLVFLLLILLLHLADFGTFFGLQTSPKLPPALCAMALFALALFAVKNGSATVGRFALLCTLILIPILLLLFPNLFGGSFENLTLPSRDESLAATIYSSLGIFTSVFGDFIALPILAGDVLSPTGATGVSPTVYASAERRAAEDTFPTLSHPLRRIRRHAVRNAVLLGALPACLLLILTVIGNQTHLDVAKLSGVIYPIPYASSLLHRHVLDPFFLLSLTLLYTVKAMTLLLASQKLLSSLLSDHGSIFAAVSLPLLTCAAFGFFILHACFPRLSLHARDSLPLFVILTVIEISLPFCRQIELFIEKRFDKRRDV